MLRHFASFVMGPRGPTLRLLGSPHRVLAETVSRFMDQVVFCVPFRSLSPSLCTSISVFRPPLLSFLPHGQVCAFVIFLLYSGHILLLFY